MARGRSLGPPITLFSFQDLITAVTGILILITLILCLSIVARPDRMAEQPPVDVEALRAELETLSAEVSELQRQADLAEQQAAMVAGFAPADLDRQLQASKANYARLQKLLAELQQQNQATDQEWEAQSADHKALADQEGEHAHLQRQLEQLRQELSSILDGDRVVYNFRNTGGNVPWLLEVSSDRFLVARSGKQEPPQVFDNRSATRRVAELAEWVKQLPRDDRYFVVLVKPSGTAIYAALGETHGVRAILDRADASVGIDLIPEDRVAIDPQKGASF